MAEETRPESTPGPRRIVGPEGQPISINVPEPTVVFTNRLSEWQQKLVALAGVVTSLGTLFLVVATLLIFFVAWSEYDDFKLQRELELVDQSFERFYSPTMLQARRAAAQAVDQGTPSILQVFQFFERMGIQTRVGLLTPKQVHEHFGGLIDYYWCGWRNWVEERRMKTGKPDIWIEFEHLHEAVNLVDGKDAGECISEDDILRMAETETKVADDHINKLYGSALEPIGQ